MNFSDYDAPEWEDLPIETSVEDVGHEAKQDALRDSFKSFQETVAPTLSQNMLAGNAIPAMFREAVRRLTNMLQIAGELGDFKTEGDIARTISNVSMVAQQTIYF